MRQKKIRGKRNAAHPLHVEPLEDRRVLAVVVPNYIGVGEIGESGTLEVDDTWTTVNLEGDYNNPVVIAGPASRAGSDPLSVRVRNADNDSFEIALNEWDYLDGGHGLESVSYLVVEGGNHELSDGSRLMAGFFQDQNHNWTSHSTGSVFGSRPIVLSQIMTVNDTESATTRTRFQSDNTFEITIQDEEGGDGVHANETVGFIAIEPGVGTTGRRDFQVFQAGNNVTQASTSFPFDSSSFSATPSFFANMQSTVGVDTATVRYTSLNSSEAKFFIEEEKSSDTETLHVGEVVGGLAIEPGVISVDEWNRYDTLHGHVLNDVTLTYTELKQLADEIQSKSADLRSDRSELEKAIAVIDSYENSEGPLFTNGGIKSLRANWWPQDNMDNGLARVMHQLYISVLEAVDADLVNNHTNIADGLKFDSVAYFPGSVPDPTNSNYQVQIDASLSAEWGAQMAYSAQAARRPTGAYLSPGSIVEVTVPQSMVNQGYRIRVNAHTWDFSNKPTSKRINRVSNTFEITSTVTKVANPNGGNIYIEVPVGAGAGIVNIQFKNAIRAPFFSDRDFDQTSNSEWNTERGHPGAFTDIESDQAMWTVPSKWVRGMAHSKIIEIIEAHEATMDAVSTYVGKNTDRNKTPLYAIDDVFIRSAAFSIGYPLGNYSGFDSTNRRSPLTVDHAYNKVMLHEHGHAEFVTMFGGEAEAIQQMLAVAVGNKVYGEPLQEAFSTSVTYGPGKRTITTGDALNSWVLMDSFINNSTMVYRDAAYKHRGWGDYVEYVDLFGWDAIENFNRTINVEMNGKDWDTWTAGSRTNHNANDRILRLSREAGVDVTPLFHVWGHKPSNSSALASSHSSEDLRPSALIYDRMVQYRDAVPRTQTQYNHFFSSIGSYINESIFDDWSADFDEARGLASANRIDALIDQYFPDGRPVTLPCDYVGQGDGCNIDDIDALYAGSDGAPTPLTDSKISQWLADASVVSNPLKGSSTHRYVSGDINLDGAIDSSDLGVLLNNFNDINLGWGDGNLNTDSVVDSADLGRLVNNFGFTSVAATSVEAVAPFDDASDGEESRTINGSNIKIESHGSTFSLSDWGFADPMDGEEEEEEEASSMGTLPR